MENVAVNDTIPEAIFEGGEVYNRGGETTSKTKFNTNTAAQIIVEKSNRDATWKVGRKETIEWTEESVSGDVFIWLYRGDGELVRKIYRWSGSGPATWTVPPYIEPGDDYYIVIFSQQNPNIRDRTNGTFTIEEGAGPYITTLSLDGGEKWIAGEEATIRWTSRNVEGEVFIKLYKGEIELVDYITRGTADDGSYTLTIPDDFEPRTDYYISVKSVEDNSVWDTGGRFQIGYPNTDLSGIFNTRGRAWDVDVAGNIAYVADQDGGMTMVYIADSSNPREVATVETPGRAVTVEVANDVVYIADVDGRSAGI